MKKRIYLLVGALCIIMQLVSSCTNFLEVEEKGKTTIPSFLSDPDGLNAGLVGAYNKMYAYYDNEFTKYPDVAGNMLSMKYVLQEQICLISIILLLMLYKRQEL